MNEDFIIYDNALIKYLGEDKHVVIPEGITCITDDAFFSCDIHSLVIPTTVIEISKYAFTYCPNLVVIYNLSNVYIKDICFNFDEIRDRPIVISKSPYDPSP